MNFRSASLVTLLLISQIAAAQDTVVLDTIRVRGTKEEKTYLENSESVSVLKENELPATGRENGIQILNAVPNVEVNKNGESFSIRGINSTGVTGFQKDNLASIVVDDLFQTDLAIQAGSFDLWDLDQIEVLRGAQSTSQGVNSLAGTILLDHRKPAPQREGAAKFGLGNFGHREFGVAVNESLSEKIATRITYDKEMNDGFIENVTTGNDRWGMWNKDRATARFVYAIAAGETLDLKLNYNRNDQGGTYTQGADAFKYEVAEDQDFNLFTDNQQYRLTYTKPLSEAWSNIATVGFSKSHQTSKTDADGSAQNTAGVRIEAHDDHYAQFENRLHYRSEKFDNLIGLHVHDFKLTDDFEFNLLFPMGPGMSTPVAVGQPIDRIRKTYAVFDSFTYRFDDAHSVFGGARVETVDSKYWTDVYGYRLQDLGPAGNAMVDSYIAGIDGAYEGSNSGAVLLPKIGYGFTQGQHYAGVSYTRGYRTSGISINRRRATAVEYAPEFTNNYEIFYKHSNEKTQLGANVFFIDWQSQQVQVQLSNDFYDSQVQNAASSQVYGAELEGRTKLGARHALHSGVGFNETKFNDFKTRTTDYAGKKFPFASQWTGRVAYEFKPSEPWNLLAVVRYVGESFTNAENTRKADEQFYLNLGARYAVNSWMLEGFVNNVLNGEYRIFDGAPSSASSPYQGIYHQTSTPREFGARLNYFW